MQVLITGGTGFIGSHLAEALLARGHAVTVVDNFATSRSDIFQGAPRAPKVVEADVADEAAMKRVFEAAKPDVVVHAAASYKDPDAWLTDVRTNAQGTAVVVQAAKRAGVKRFIYFQTALCYGNYPKAQPVPIDHPRNPESSYAISKTAGEHYIELSGLDWLIFRLANIYGPRNVSGPIPTFYQRLTANKACFAVTTRRDFLYIGDLLKVVVPAVEGKGTKGHYHISSGHDVSIKDVYDAVAAALKVDKPVEIRPAAPDDAPTILLDPSKTQREFAWEARTPLKTGVADAVAWYKVHGVDQTYTHLRMKE